MVGVMVYVEANERGRCLSGKRLNDLRKRVPRKDSKPVRRQRPCQGGEPQKTKKKKRTKIGRFYLEKGQSFFTAIGGDPVKRATYRVALEAGYRPRNSGRPVVIESELDKPRTFFERLIERLFKGTCFYQVYAIEEVTRCTCPDGSPCRSTTRKD